MIPSGSETWFEGYTFNPDPLLRDKLEREYNIILREEFHDAIDMLLEFQFYTSPTTNSNIMKELFVCQDNTVNILFREKYTNAYIYV